jgi:hypothetical protein
MRTRSTHNESPDTMSVAGSKEGSTNMKAARSGKPREIARPNTSAKVGKSRRNRGRTRPLTGRQENFSHLITTPPLLAILGSENTTQKPS